VKILDRYLLRVTMAPLGAGLGLFVFALVMDRLFDLLDLVLNRGVSPLTVGRLLLCFLPSVLAVALPMATLLATVLAFGRLAHDRELLAMKGAGLSPFRLAAPVVGLGAAFSALLLAFNGTVLPAAATRYKEIFLGIVRQRASVAFRERVFIREFDRYLLYYNRREGREGDLRDVTILEAPPVPARIIAARRGRLHVEPGSYRVTLLLEDGVMDQPADRTGEHYTRVEFEEYAIDLDIHNALREGPWLAKGLEELTYGELLRRRREARGGPDERSYDVALHQKIAVAFAPLFVALIGAPLGSLARRGGAAGVLLSFAVIFLYYALLSVGRGLAQRGSWAVWPALWLPNLFLIAAAALAFWAALREATWMRRGR
jgi:lipopolysaccharide export system permease protein